MSEWNINNSMGDSLEHHGILGMHWGIRRFQPYPKGYKGKGREVGDAAKSNREINDIWNKELKKEKKKLKEERDTIAKKAIDIAKRTNYFNDKSISIKERDKAAKEYNKLWDEYAVSKRTSGKVARSKARETMVKRFGQTRIDEVDKYLKKWDIASKIGTGVLAVVTLNAIRNNMKQAFLDELADRLH